MEWLVCSLVHFLTRRSYKPGWPPILQHSLYYREGCKVGGITSFVVVVKTCTRLHITHSKSCTLVEDPHRWIAIRSCNPALPITLQHPLYYKECQKVGGGSGLFFWAARGSRLHTKILNRLVQKLNIHNVMRSSSPLTNLNGILTNINIT